ncbi:MAG TPA: hypothetical protein VKV77_04115 [Methylovirgula sp.]|nr:hypothetical protein [Methylovirgula sp.]
MKAIGKLAIAASAIFWITAAVAQDTETSTTVTRDRPASPPGAYVGVPGVAGVQVGPGPSDHGCEHRSKTVHNEDTGDTYSKSETRC